MTEGGDRERELSIVENRGNRKRRGEERREGGENRKEGIERVVR